jgi:hypothetical protein
MEFAPAGVVLSCEVTYDSPSLNVGMSVYDDSGTSPVLILGPIAMGNVVGNTYRGKFTAVNGKNYVIFKAVYTDGTLTVLSSNYSQASETIVAQNLSGGSSAPSSCAVVGFVNLDNPIFGFVNC